MRLRPLIHGRDHEHGGADPVRISWESVGEGGGGGGAGIRFVTDPQQGDWLVITTTGEEPYSDGARGVGDGMLLENTGTGGIEIRQGEGSENGIYINSSGGGIGLNVTGSDPAAGGQIRITNNSDGGDSPEESGIFIEDSGSGGDIVIKQDGNAGMVIQNTGGTVGMRIENDGNSPVDINNFGDNAAALINIRNTGNGGINIEDDGDGGINLYASGEAVNITGAGGVTITMESEYLTLAGLPTTNPGGSHRVWNDGGTLKIT